MVRLFFADSLPDNEAGALLDAVRCRSQVRIADLRAILPAAEAASEGHAGHPRLTLRIGIAFHQAMVDVCEQFARETAAAHGSPRRG